MTRNELSDLAALHPGGAWDERRLRPNLVLEGLGDEAAEAIRATRSFAEALAVAQEYVIFAIAEGE